MITKDAPSDEDEAEDSSSSSNDQNNFNSERMKELGNLRSHHWKEYLEEEPVGEVKLTKQCF